MLCQTIFRVVKNDTLKMGHKIAYEIKRSDGYAKIFVEDTNSYSLLALSVKKKVC